MSKKGASQSGGGAGRTRAKDQARVAYLPETPRTWNPRPWEFPYHSNMGKGRRARPGRSPWGEK